MRDAALTALLREATAGPGLVVLDENHSDSLPPPPAGEWRAASNRCDVAHAARTAGWNCACNDFDFNAVAPLRQALYRISKEKRVAEHVLESLWEKLEVGGELCLTGYKQEGVKTLASRAATAWQTTAALERGDGGLHLYRLRKHAPSVESLADGAYHRLREIGEWQGTPLWSKPGIFAWDRIDDGSRLLLEQLPHTLQGLDLAECSGLDLGCGYGLLALALAQAGCARVIATDNNAAAIAATSHNLQQVSVRDGVQVVLDDCAGSIRERVDLLLCNPPFHQGFAVEGSLTDRFLAAAKRLLKPKAQALFVVNAFIPLERKAQEHFARVETLANDRRFKVLRLTLEQTRKAR